ncbi:MAG: sigma-70 family RNA polymerase sigma factor [Bryobacterales bacterium]|nr:sigma-70 family RNA polymerase sigma factor [Bryobacterales bacterium]
MRLALAKEGIPDIPHPLESTFQAHHGLVFRTAYRITGNAADAEDVLQTVFLRLLRRDAGGGDLLQPESYLRRAAINCSIDLIRDRMSGTANLDHVAHTSGEDPELKQRLRQAIAQLDPKDAEIFVLRFFEGHSNEDIAQLTGMNKLLVAVKIHRIRHKLQKEIK